MYCYHNIITLPIDDLCCSSVKHCQKTTHNRYLYFIYIYIHTVYKFVCSAYVGLPQVLWFPPTSKKPSSRHNDYNKFPLCVNERTWCLLMDCFSIQAIFPAHVQPCQDRLQISRDSDEAKLLTESEWERESIVFVLFFLFFYYTGLFCKWPLALTVRRLKLGFKIGLNFM